jgi:hypothetical protein
MRIERHKNFLTSEECNLLNVWVDEGVEKKWLDTGVTEKQFGYTSYTKRVTSRMYGNRFQYPQIALDISNRIRKLCGIDSYGLIEGHGRDGIVVSCTFTGGDVSEHYDAKSKFENGLSALKCNVMTRNADIGGELYVGGEHLDIEVGELHCYLASDFKHKVTEVEGETSRVLWMFGAYVPFEDWESGKIKFNY